MSYFLKFSVDELGVLQCERVACEDEVIPYKKLRDGVGNIIQYVYHVDLGDDSLALVVDEEGLLNGLKPTFWLIDEEAGKVVSIPLVGNVLVVRLEGGETKCLSELDIDKVKEKVLVDKVSGRYFLPINNSYIKRNNEFMNELFGRLSDK